MQTTSFFKLWPFCFPNWEVTKFRPEKVTKNGFHLPRSTWQPLRLGNLLSLQGPELGLKILRTRQTATAWGDKQVGIAGKRHLKITLTVSQPPFVFCGFFSRKRFRVCCIFEVFLTEVFLTNPIFFVFYRFLVVLRVFWTIAIPHFEKLGWSFTPWKINILNQQKWRFGSDDYFPFQCSVIFRFKILQ